jgi:Replication-relaxation
MSPAVIHPTPLLPDARPASARPAARPDSRHGAGGPASAAALRPLPYQMLPVLRASNGPVYIHPDDRKYGALLVGGQGSGKTSAMLRMYLSDIRDSNAAPIVVDPKSELARLCLEMTPPDCAKRVWYLDLGRPMFGMSPLRLDPARSLPEQASAIADNIVQAISDTAEGQVFQSSRRYLYHAVIGSLALAHRHGGLAMFEDVFALLLPGRDDLREQAVNACQGYADLDHTTEFFARVLPEELENNRSNTYQRLDPPRNKIETILASPALRRFFNHPVDIRLADIVMARDILIVDANMGALGEENSQVAMHFLFQGLHALMQQLIHLAPEERPRVPTIWDEGGYIASMSTVKQAATHREAGLEVVMGIQYLSQLGAKAESAAVTEAIRKGITNLLQSFFLFRVGDPEDAQAATRVAMSVFQTMIRSDIDSRELMGVTPEQALYLAVHLCLASWIAGGARAARFYGQTYPFVKLRNGAWAQHHLRRLEEQTGPYPEQMPKTYRRTGPSAGGEQSQQPQPPASGRAPDGTGAAAPRAARSTRSTPARRGDTTPAGQPAPSRPAAPPRPPNREVPERDGHTQPKPSEPARADVTPLIREAAEVPEVGAGPVREVLGATAAPDGPQRLFAQDGGPQGLRELAAYVDPLLGIRDSEQQEPTERLPRMYAEDYAILALLDRVGLALPGMLRRAVMPRAAERTMRGRINDKLYRNGLIARWPIVLRDAPRGALPYLYSLTRYGLEVAQARQPPAVPPTREFRAQEVEKDSRVRHDLHMLAWVIELHRLLGDQATDKWRTPRWPAGVCAVPQTRTGRNRRPITLKDIKRPKHVGIFDVDSKDIARIEPDAICEIKLLQERLTLDLLIELDLTDRASYNLQKFRRYDAFLTAWWSETRRYQQLGTRPGVVFVCRTPEMALTYARAADELMRGSIGVTGSPAHERYYPGRQHVWFASESDIHEGDLTMLALPALPPEIREALDGTRSLALSRVLLFPEQVIRAGQRTGTT